MRYRAKLTLFPLRTPSGQSVRGYSGGGSSTAFSSMVFGMCTPEERRFSIFSLEAARLIAQHILGDKRAGSGGSVAHRFLRLAPNLLAPCGPFEPRLFEVSVSGKRNFQARDREGEKAPKL